MLNKRQLKVSVQKLYRSIVVEVKKQLIEIIASIIIIVIAWVVYILFNLLFR